MTASGSALQGPVPVTNEAVETNLTNLLERFEDMITKLGDFEPYLYTVTAVLIFLLGAFVIWLLYRLLRIFF